MEKSNSNDAALTKKAGFFGDLLEKIYTLLDNKKIKWGVFAVIFALALGFPLVSTNYWISVAQNAMFFMLLALGLNIIVGYTGICNFGFAAHFAIGAYVTAILVRTFEWSFWLTLPVSFIASIIVACIVAGPTLRLRSDYLAIVTLGFGEIVRITARNLSITGGASGLSGISRPELFGMHLTTITHWYYVFLVLVILYVIISNRIKNSRFGRALQYIREDEDAAMAMGVNTAKFKLFAFIVGATMGGLAGSFFTVRMGAISPQSFQFLMSANILLSVVLGGMGKIPGVMVGAAFIAFFPEIFRDIPFVGTARMLFFGILLVVVMIKRPQGLWPERKR